MTEPIGFRISRTCAAAFVTGGLMALHVQAETHVRVLAEHVLPAQVQWLADVRWLGDTTVALAAGPDGTFALTLGGKAPPSLLVAGSGPRRPGPRQLNPDSVWAHTSLGASPRFLAVGAPSFQVGWRPLQGEGRVTLAEFGTAVDLDVHGDRLLVAGVRDQRGSAAPGIPIVWEVNLAAAEPSFRPSFAVAATIAPVVLGDWMMASEAPAVRFLPDGSHVVVPGVEAGVYWYQSDGKLRRAWESEALGLDVAMGPDPRVARRANSGAQAQLAMRNAWRLVDEILPLPGGPGLVVRRVQDQKVSWEIKQLHADGHISVIPLPLSVSSPNWFLAGDVRGSRVILVAFEYCVRAPRTCTPSRLVELEVMP